MINKKADNQWYGKAFEQVIVMVKTNSNIINPYPNYITNIDWQELINDAKIFIAQYEKIEPIITIQWIGNHTSLENGDLIINGEKIEIKRVSEGNGTYLNTSWLNCQKRYGFNLNPRQYLTETNLYTDLINKFSDKVNLINDSPFSEDEASRIMKEEKNWYNNYKKKEAKLREKYVENIYNYLQNNPNVAVQFLSDIIDKSISGKNIPDKLIVFNYVKKEITLNYSKNNLYSLSTKYNLTKSARQKVGFCIGNFRIQIGWQNGAGLCNATVRAFIK